MSSTGPTRTRLLQTAASFIAAFNEWSIEAILAIRSPTCIYHTLPATLGVSPRNNDDYAHFLVPMLAVFRELEFVIISEAATVVDVAARKVVLHCRNKADTDAGNYQNEYVFILSMSEDGTLLDEVVEFIDSAYTRDFKNRLISSKSTA